MSQRTRRRRKNPVKPSLPPPSWTGDPCLELVREFNERFLEQLTQVAQADGGRRISLDLLRLHRESWVALDEPARQHAARIPLLLADVHGRNVAWWRSATASRARTPAKSSAPAIFAPKQAVELMRHALQVLWFTARWDPDAASILLALSPEVATIVAGLGLLDIERLAEQHHRELRPRLEQLPLFWRHLLTAARSGDAQAIHALHLHSMQLLGAGASLPTPGPLDSEPPADA